MLTGADYRQLAARWIDMAWAERAKLDRVDQRAGSEYVGATDFKRDYSGVWVPYNVPTGIPATMTGNHYGALRRDHHEWEERANGERKPKNKYMRPRGRNYLYFPPGLTADHLRNRKLRVVITEGELKTIALRRLADYKGELAFVPVGLGGVWNWRTQQGKTIYLATGAYSDQGVDGYLNDFYLDDTPTMGALAEFRYFDWVDRDVVIAFDADLIKNPKVQQARHSLTKFIRSLGARVGFLEWNEIDGRNIPAKGIDDRLARDGPEIVYEEILHCKCQDAGGWYAQMLAHDNGKTKALMENARVIFAEHPAWAGTLQFDTFLGRLTCSRRPWNHEPCVWSENDSRLATCWLHREAKVEVKKTDAFDAIMAAAHQYDSAQQWLNGLRWDGVPRLDGWLCEYMNVEMVDGEKEDITHYISAIGAKWLIGGAARILQPGCQMDYALVLCGAEGLGKSTALKILGHGWSIHNISDISGDEGLIKLQGNLIVEFAELRGWNSSRVEDLRAFLTNRDDKFRGKYERFSESHPRRQIFAGTTNRPTFIDSDSEERRLWPVRVMRKIDVKKLERDHEQLWAEAKERFCAGELPMLDEEIVAKAALRAREQFREEVHPWVQWIGNYMKVHEHDDLVTTADLLKHAIGVDMGRMGKNDSRRIGEIMRGLGFAQYNVDKNGLKGWRRG